MKNKIGNICLILLGIAAMAYLAITAVMDLTNTADVHTPVISSATEFLEIEHSINGLIPIGKDYYYLGYDEENDSIYVIRGPKNWGAKNFTDDAMSINPGGLKVSALAKRISDFQTRDNIRLNLSEVPDEVFPVGKDACLDLNYKLNAILKLVDFALFIFVIVGFLKIRKMEDKSSPLAKVVFVAFMVALALMLVVLR